MAATCGSAGARSWEPPQLPVVQGASILRLNTIAETCEKIRAWAEASWDSMNLNSGGGRMDPETGFRAEPFQNPHALKAPVSR